MNYTGIFNDEVCKVKIEFFSNRDKTCITVQEGENFNRVEIPTKFFIKFYEMIKND